MEGSDMTTGKSARNVKSNRVGNTSSSKPLKAAGGYTTKNGPNNSQGDTGKHGSKVSMPKGKMPRSS